MATTVEFPVIELDASAPQPAYYKVVLTINTKQDGQPWVDVPLTYHHCSAARVSSITGGIVDLVATFGPKGTRPKNADFDLSVGLTVDGKQVAGGEWNGLALEHLLTAERGLLNMWLAMNENSFKANKAHGKI